MNIIWLDCKSFIRYSEWSRYSCTMLFPVNVINTLLSCSIVRGMLLFSGSGQWFLKYCLPKFAYFSLCLFDNAFNYPQIRFSNIAVSPPCDCYGNFTWKIKAFRDCFTFIFSFWWGPNTSKIPTQNHPSVLKHLKYQQVFMVQECNWEHHITVLAGAWDEDPNHVKPWDAWLERYLSVGTTAGTE